MSLDWLEHRDMERGKVCELCVTALVGMVQAALARA
jgi:hypothetical protein